MLDLTVDVCVLMVGSGLSRSSPPGNCLRLMEHMMDTSGWYLVLDKEGMVVHQYMTKMKEGTLGHHWVRRMAEIGKTVPVARKKIGRDTVTRLEDAGFPRKNEDFKIYVRTAAASSSKILASHDPHYTLRVRSILLKKEHIRVHSAPQVLLLPDPSQVPSADDPYSDLG